MNEKTLQELHEETVKGTQPIFDAASRGNGMEAVTAFAAAFTALAITLRGDESVSLLCRKVEEVFLTHTPKSLTEFGHREVFRLFGKMVSGDAADAASATQSGGLN